jgi:type IV pilus assembly protein PilN
VILINLLPHREDKRKRRKSAFFVGLGVSAVVGLAIAGVWYLVLEQMISAQEQRNQYVRAEITKLDAQIKDIASLRSEIESLRARQKAVEDLQTNRNVPVYLLSDLVRQTPEGVYLTTIRQTDRTVSIDGIAQTQERVSEFLRNTSKSAEWLERPELVEISATNAQGRRMFKFVMRVTIKRPSGEAPSDAAAAGAKKA